MTVYAEMALKEILKRIHALLNVQKIKSFLLISNFVNVNRVSPEIQPTEFVQPIVEIIKFMTEMCFLVVAEMDM